TATGIILFNFLYSLKWRADTLCLCQCMPVIVGVNTCMRYMPMLRIPLFGSLVCIDGNVIKRPPSFGQHFNIGNLSRLGSLITTCWHSPRPLTTLGIQDENLPNLGNIANF